MDPRVSAIEWQGSWPIRRTHHGCKVLFLYVSVFFALPQILWTYRQHAVLSYGIFMIYSVILFRWLINKYQDPWFVRGEGPLHSSPLNSQHRLCTLRRGRVFGQPLKMTSCPLTANRWALVSRLPLFFCYLYQGLSEHIWCPKIPGWSSFSGKKWPNMWVPIFRHTHTWEDDHFHVEALVEFPNQLSFVDQRLCGPYWVVREGLGWWIRHPMVVVPVVHYFGLPRQPEARERWRRLQCTPTWAKKIRLLVDHDLVYRWMVVAGKVSCGRWPWESGDITRSI